MLLAAINFLITLIQWLTVFFVRCDTVGRSWDPEQTQCHLKSGAGKAVNKTGHRSGHIVTGRPSSTASVEIGLVLLPFSVPPAGGHTYGDASTPLPTQLVDFGFDFSEFYNRTRPASFQSRDPDLVTAAKQIYSQLASYRGNVLVACGAIAVGPLVRLTTGTAASGAAPPTAEVTGAPTIVMDTSDMDELIQYAFELGVAAFAVPHPHGGGPRLAEAHTVTAADTWVFGYNERHELVQSHILANMSQQEGINESVLDPTFVKLFVKVYGKLASHLKAKGWLDKVILVLLESIKELCVDLEVHVWNTGSRAFC